MNVAVMSFVFVGAGGAVGACGAGAEGDNIPGAFGVALGETSGAGAATSRLGVATSGTAVVGVDGLAVGDGTMPAYVTGWSSMVGRLPNPISAASGA